MSYCGAGFGLSPADLIDSQLSMVMNYGNTAYNQAMSAMAAIASAFGGASETFESGISSSGPGWNVIQKYGIDLPSFVKPTPTPELDSEEFTLPDLPPSSVDAASGIPDGFLGITNPLALMDDRLDVLIATFNDAIDRCSVSTELCAVLVTMMNGEIALSDETISAMRNRAYSSEDWMSISEEKQVLEEWLARGFTQPSGVLDAKLLLIKQKNRDKRSEINRTILIEEEKFALQTQQFGVEQGVRYETALRDYYIKLFETAKDMVTAAFGFNLETAKLKLEEWARQLDHFKTLLQGEVSRIQASVELSNGKVRLYEVLLTGEKYSTDLEATEQGLNLQKAKIEGDITMKAYELDQQKLIEQSRMALSALEGIARTGSQLAAGAMSALNMSASIGNSTSFSNENSCSTNYNVTVD